MPSTDVINVEFGALRNAADSLSTKAQALINQIEELSRNLTPLKETWYASGSSAGQAAEQSETRLRTATNDVITVINQFSGKVNEAHDLQQDLENKTASYFI